MLRKLHTSFFAILFGLLAMIGGRYFPFFWFEYIDHRTLYNIISVQTEYSQYQTCQDVRLIITRTSDIETSAYLQREVVGVNDLHREWGIESWINITKSKEPQTLTVTNKIGCIPPGEYKFRTGVSYKIKDSARFLVYDSNPFIITDKE